MAASYSTLLEAMSRRAISGVSLLSDSRHPAATKRRARSIATQRHDDFEPRGMTTARSLQQTYWSLRVFLDTIVFEPKWLRNEWLRNDEDDDDDGKEVNG